MLNQSNCCSDESMWADSPYTKNIYSCSDDYNNDCDGLIDCNDLDCSGISVCL